MQHAVRPNTIAAQKRITAKWNLKAPLSSVRSPSRSVHSPELPSMCITASPVLSWDTYISTEPMIPH